jgi:hypothetical protein
MLAMPEGQVGDEYEDGAVDVHHAVLVQVLLQVDDAQDEGDHLKQYFSIIITKRDWTTR